MSDSKSDRLLDMNPSWQQYLTAKGALIADGRVAHFGDAASEIQATGTGPVLADLSHLGVIAFSGDDAQSFLHGQLSCDVMKLNPAHAEYGGYCTAKGRMLAVFLLWQKDRTLFMQLPAEIRVAVQKRLGMFVLRFKVKMEDASDAWVRMGLAGSGAAALLKKTLGAIPGKSIAGPQMHSVAHLEAATVIALDSERFEILVPPERAPALWDALVRGARPVGSGCWDWLEIKSGVPVVLTRTQEQFVPQMTNLELIGGVSFQKGCYPGQEIVARTQFLGKLKRRMYLAHIDGDGMPVPGDELFSPDMEGQASGMIVNSAPSPHGGYDVLAVIQSGSAEGNAIHWKFPDGPRLQLMPLPYSV